MKRFPEGPAGPWWRPWALAISALAVLLTLGALVTMTGRHGRSSDPGETPPAAAPRSDRLYLGGLDYSGYDGSEPVYRVQARELIHRKRAFGPLTISPVKEVEIDGLRVDLFPPPAGSGTGSRPVPRSLDQILKKLLESKNLGFISRVVLKDIAVEDQSGGKAFRFAADEVVWRPGEKRVVVHGSFEHREGTETERGTDGAFDLADDGRLVRVH
ncbi:MAG TPA: hypothetical protein VFQ07_11295 [Candidatus Polarisedimenticolia bacterium]|nr:hypothetical protein [Candidatus Polarisedimenticolia bacterium]